MKEPDIILYGGSFDPPHSGHSACIKLARSRFPNATIIIIPSFTPPSSRKKTKLTHASFEQRYEMCKISFSELLKDKAVELNAIEKTLPTPNYTIQTIRHLKSVYAKQSIAWMLGSDQLNNLCHWKDPLTIISEVSLLVIGREQKSPLIDQLSEVIKRLNIKIINKSLDFLVLDGNKTALFYIDKHTSTAASNKVREYIVNESSLPKDWITSEVESYLSAKHMYKGKK